MGFLLFPDLYFNSLWSGFSNILLFVLGQRPLYFVTLKLEPSSIISYSLLPSVSNPPASFHILFYFQFRTLQHHFIFFFTFSFEPSVSNLFTILLFYLFTFP